MAIFGKKKEKVVTAQSETPVQEQAAVPSKLPQGEDAGAYQTVVRPHLTEKAALAGALNKYVFRVSPAANKPAIKQAIERLYKVHVTQVAVITLPAKIRRLGRQLGQRAGFKKAIVTLRTGDKIDLAS